MDRIELRAEPRSVLGKQVRALRRTGTVPANIYGHGRSTAVQIPAKETEQVLSRAGRTHLVYLTMDGGGPTTVVVKDYQRHPIKRSLLHVDFYRVAMTETLRIDVPVRLVGDAPGIKEYEATVFQPLTTLSAESLPADLPDVLEVDVSGLHEIDSAVYVRDIQAPSGVTILTDPDEIVVKLLAPTIEVEPDEPVAAAEEAGEAAEAAQSEDAES